MKSILTLRFAIAAVVLAIFAPYNEETAFVLAGMVMVFPSWKFVRGRLAVGEQEESAELKELKAMTTKVAQFEQKLGDRAAKADFDALKGQLEDFKKNMGKYSEKELDERLNLANTSITKINKQMEEMVEDLRIAKENGGRSRKAIKLFDEAEALKFHKELFPSNTEKNNGKIASVIKMNTGMIIHKAAEVMGYPDFFNGDGEATVDDMSVLTGRVVDPELNQRKRKKNFILDNFSIQPINAPFLYYLDKEEVSGDDGSNEDPGSAEWIVPGQQKPMRSFRVSVKKAERKKVAIYMNVHDELLRDIPSFYNWLREDATDEMREAFNDGLLNNDPDVDETAPLGLKINAIAFSLPSGWVAVGVTVNDIDAIIAAIARMSELREEPQLVAVSDVKYYQLLMLKDTQGRYQNNNLIYTNSAGQLYIAGVRIVRADSSDIPTTHFMLIGADAFKIKSVGPTVFEQGLNGEDFRNDKTSFRGYQYVLSYISKHRYNAVMYDAFTTVKAAID